MCVLQVFLATWVKKSLLSRHRQCQSTVHTQTGFPASPLTHPKPLRTFLAHPAAEDPPPLRPEAVWRQTAAGRRVLGIWLHSALPPTLS